MLRIYLVVLEWMAGAVVLLEQIERRDRDLDRQMRKALTSVALNTAEGAGNNRCHKLERYQTALGSAREVMACVDSAKALRYIAHVDPAWLDQGDHVIATLVVLVKGRR